MPIVKKLLQDKYSKDYTCGWCGHEFVAHAFYEREAQGKAGFSTKVTCPKCCREIPTWKREETSIITGRKHWHPDRKAS